MIRKLKNITAAIYNLQNDVKVSTYHQSALLVKSILEQQKYKDPRNISRYTMKFFSQFGEDGLINEIFNRIGTTNRFFIEFGVGNGLENNTAFQLMINKWEGLWIEGSKESCDFIQRTFHKYVLQQKLQIKNRFITAENIEQIFKEASVPAEPDLLSIDIDGNDYYVWKAISKYKPRVVVVEYNASYGPQAENAIPYSPANVWTGTNQFGSSLKLFELLGHEKGYRLVGCDIAGINAFFIRQDLIKSSFQEPFTSEFHYEPPRYYLRYFGGHEPSIPQS